MPTGSTIERDHRSVEANSSRDLNLNQAADFIPPGRNGRPTHPATISRWITEGASGPDGQVVRLRAIRMGGRWLTKPEWLEEFGRRLTPTFDAIPADAEGVSS